MVLFLFMAGARVLDGKAIHLAASHGVIFGDIMQDLMCKTKYSTTQVDNFINAVSTFCNVHGSYHNLWDYLPLNLHMLAMTLLKSRNLEPVFRQEPYTLAL